MSEDQMPNEEPEREEQKKEEDMPMPQHVIYVDGDHNTRVAIVLAHVIGYSVQPPPDKGETWHQQPESERPGRFTVHQLGHDVALNMTMEEAHKVAERIHNHLHAWYEYQLHTPRPALLIPPTFDSGDKGPNIMLPNVGSFHFKQ